MQYNFAANASLQLVLDDNGHEIFGIACCKSCNVAITFKKKENGKERSLGTKNLLDHINNCKPGSRVEVTPKRSVKQPSVDKERCTSRSNDTTSHCETPLDVVNKQRTISSYMNVQNMSSSAQKRHSQDILNKTVNMVSGGYLPLKFVENAHFREFSQQLINIGASEGRIDVNVLLTGRQGCRSAIIKKAQSVKEEIKTSSEGCR